MTTLKCLLATVVALLLCLSIYADPAPADCVPPPGGKCLTAQQLDEIKKALKELDEIHKAPAVITTTDKITVIQDFDGRTYVDGGETKPLRLKLKLGNTIDRDMEFTLPTQVYRRPQPPEPPFRFRLRAQAGFLVPELVMTALKNKQNFIDGGIGWDFLHFGPVNVAAYTGILSAGGGLGVDLTKNFGLFAGPVFVYQTLRASGVLQAYFSFN